MRTAARPESCFRQSTRRLAYHSDHSHRYYRPNRSYLQKRATLWRQIEASDVVVIRYEGLKGRANQTAPEPWYSGGVIACRKYCK